MAVVEFSWSSPVPYNDMNSSSSTTGCEDSHGYAVNLLENLYELYKDGHISDVTIVVGGEKFLTHRLILSAVSGYFRAMFSHDMLEARSKVIELKDQSRVGFQIMMEFIYSGKMELNMDNIHDVVSIASFLQIIKAMGHCVHFLKMEMNFNNAKDILTVADIYELRELKDHYRTMVLENFQLFSETDDFLELDVRTLADYLGDDGLLTVKELDLLKIAEKWYRHDPKNRRKHAYEVFEKIRYTLDGWPAIDYMSRIDVFSNSKRCRELTNVSIDVMHNPTRRHLCPSHQTKVRYRRKTLIQLGGVPDDFDAIGCSTNSFYHHEHKTWLPAGCIGYFEPRSHCVLVEVNDHGILCGGYLYEGIAELSIAGVTRLPTNEVKIIHPSGFSTWDMPYMNVPRVDFAVVHVAGYLIAVGGRNNESLLKSCERYDLRNEIWMFVRELPQTLMQHAASGYNDMVYVTGGVEDGNHVVNHLRVYDPITDLWETRASMHTARSFHGQCTIGDQILVCGGWSDYRNRPYGEVQPSSRCLNSVESYNPNTDQWTIVTSMRRDCASMATVVFEGQMLVVGGEDHIGEISDQINSYDPKTQKWRHFADLQIPLKNLACCALTINLSQTLICSDNLPCVDDEDQFELEYVDWDDLVDDLRYNFNDML